MKRTMIMANSTLLAGVVACGGGGGGKAAPSPIGPGTQALTSTSTDTEQYTGTGDSPVEVRGGDGEAETSSAEIGATTGGGLAATSTATETSAHAGADSESSSAPVNITFEMPGATGEIQAGIENGSLAIIAVPTVVTNLAGLVRTNTNIQFVGRPANQESCQLRRGSQMVGWEVGHVKLQIPSILQEATEYARSRGHIVNNSQGIVTATKRTVHLSISGSADAITSEERRVTIEGLWQREASAAPASFLNPLGGSLDVTLPLDVYCDLSGGRATIDVDLSSKVDSWSARGIPLEGKLSVTGLQN